MAAWRFQTSQLVLPPFLLEDRSLHSASVWRSKARHSVFSASSPALWRLRGWKCSDGKLLYACSRSSTMWVMVIENFPGRVDTAVDLGVEVSDLEFVPDILDIRYRENNRAAPPVVPYYPTSEGHGPSELDFEIYASNSMEDYEPPPPPRIPFGFPFEDYYDEAIGVDYISKEEKPANSLLQFLDSLNAKKVDDGGNNSKRPLFAESHRRLAAGTAAGKLSTDSGVGRDTDGQVLVNASRPTDVNISSPEAEENLAQRVVSANKAMEESSEKSPLSMYSNKQEYSSPTSSTRVDDSGKPSLQSRVQNGSQEALNGALSVVNEVFDEASIEDRTVDSSKANVGSAPLVLSIKPSQITEDVYTPTFLPAESIEQIQLTSEQVSLEEGVSQSKSSQSVQQNVQTVVRSELHANHIQGDVSAKTGMPSLVGPTTVAQAQNSFKEATHKSRYYEPQEGNAILGAVTFINDQKVDLEIGAELSALMPLRELQPFSQNVEKVLFEIPSTEESYDVPLGVSFLVKDKMVSDSLPGNGPVNVGTVVLAEVTGRTIIDGRAILSCKALAQRLAWHRIEQLMRLGEAVQLEIVQWNEGGLLGYFEGIRAFVPKSELLQRPESISVLKSYVGRACTVAILQTDIQKSNVIMSEVRAWMSKNLKLGTVHDVTVTRVHSYGMQVEVINTKIRGFVHKTNFSNEYVSSVSNYFAEDDKARVMLIKGRNPGQISFSLADLEKENGLLLRDKEQVFKDAEEMGKRFREHLSEEERHLFGPAASEASLPYQSPEIANLAWLHLSTVAP